MNVDPTWKRPTVTARLAWCAATGLVIALATPPFDAFPLIWLCLAALAWLLDDDPRWPAFPSRLRVALTGGRRGLAFGLGVNLVALHFIPGVIARFTPLPWALGVLGLVLLSAFEAVRWVVACIACETLARARVPRPFAFAAGVYAGMFVPTMLPWTTAGGGAPGLPVLQLAEVVGERGVAALMALTGGLLAHGVRAMVRERAWKRGALLVGGAAAVLAGQMVHGRMRMHAVETEMAAAPHARVALVQPAIGASTRWDDDRAPSILAGLTELTHRAEARGVELVVWPETAYPYRLPHGLTLDPLGARAIRQPGVLGPVMTGVLMPGSPGGPAHNSVFVASPDGRLSAPYDKRHLLWFGETVPLADHIPFLRHVFARGLGLVPGETEVGLASGRVRAGVLVCYEDTLPEAGREAMEAHPNLLVNVTNDAWFAGSTEGDMHLRLSTMRSIELRRDMVRAVNLGPTSWVDATGRVRARAPVDFASSIVAEPALLEAPDTLYARFGDAPWAVAVLALANIAVWRAARRRR
jgi:apolipoprotein N-acyltransferase